MILKKNINKTLYLFLFSHLLVWTLIPSLSNTNLPLDTIEALAWGSNLDWGFNKHPPFSAFAIEFFYKIFGSNDWAYYLLSQIFVLISFYFVWKFSNELLEDKTYSLLSVLLLAGIYFYNFTTPEFNVNVSQLPFWALTVYFFWKGINFNEYKDWILFGIFSALGFLSKYLFIYILFSLFIFYIFNFKKYQKSLKGYLLSILISLILLIPHFIWLFENNFVTIFYGLNRSGLSELNIFNHFKNPIEFTLKQIIILVPFFLMILTLLKKIKFKINSKDRKIIFLIFINIIPILLMLATSLLSGAKIRTMWMTPFYLFAGTLIIYVFKSQINFNKLKSFATVFLILFLFSPFTYAYVSISQTDKRTDYEGLKKSNLLQNMVKGKITSIQGNEWIAGNFCYHLKSRPKCLLNNRYGNDILVWVDNKFYGKIKYNDIK